MILEVIILRVQKTEWGEIDWLWTGNKGDIKRSFSVGITSVEPGKRLLKHIHYGLEQYIHILEGEGIYIINGEKKEFKKGMGFYIEADSSHETINTGDIAIRELMVSSPINYTSETNINANLLEDIYKNINLKFDNMLYVSVEAIRTQLLESISLPFTIYDEMWSIVIQNNNFSSYCNEKCNPMKNHSECDCMLEKGINDRDSLKGHEFICKYGLTVFHYPIIYNRKYLGAIRGGHVLVSDSTDVNHDNLYDSPRSTVIGINSLLKQIVNSLLSYCAFNSSRQLIEEKDKAVREALHSNRMLEKNLYVINDKITNLRINHHFLFNTLNSLASMALDGDKYDLYNSIIDLSKMFRHTMTMDLKYVSLKSEIEYLGTYLNLQRLRYGEELEVKYSIDYDIEEISVPFNFLQPIVENAFTHGFTSSDDRKLIKIDGEKIGDRARISILNNGVPLKKVNMNRINKSLVNNTGHGLSLIYEKLKLAYGSKFEMKIKSNEKNETVVIVLIPIKEYKEV